MDWVTISTIVLAIAAIISVLFTLVIAIFNFRAVLEMRKGTKASITQKCTEDYIMIRRQRTEAIRQNSKEIAEDYYREICDLHWSEFQFYLENLISEEVLKAWLNARKRNFDSDKIELGDGQGPIIVKYSEEWKKFVDKGYFEASDPFIEFMTLVHEGKVDEALNMRNL